MKTGVALSEISTADMLEWLEDKIVCDPEDGCGTCGKLIPAIRARLSDYDALKAEVERLATEASHHQHDAFYAEQRAEKDEAELAATQKRFGEFAYGVQCLISSLAGNPRSTRGPE